MVCFLLCKFRFEQRIRHGVVVPIEMILLHVGEGVVQDDVGVGTAEAERAHGNSPDSPAGPWNALFRDLGTE